MKPSKFISVMLITTMLTACAEYDGEPGRGVMHGGSLNKEDVGTAVGAVGGGLIGSTIGGGSGRVAAIIGGALLGGVLGNSIGRSMDNADRIAYDDASQRSLEYGQAERWRNPETGHYGTITPSAPYTSADGNTCREYTQTIYVNGRRHTGYGTACRMDDGSWQIIND